MANPPNPRAPAPPAEIQRRAQATWDAFCEDLKQAGRQLIRDDLPLGELDAAEGLRYLSRLLRTGLERHVEAADPADPHLHSLCDERIKGFGGDNPDTRYFGATISGDHVYRLRGDFRSCVHVSLITNGFDAQGAWRITGNLDSNDLPEARERPLEIEIGGSGADGRLRLPTTRETKSLLVRCTFAGLADKPALELELTRADASGEPVRVAFEPIAEGLLATAKFVRTTAEMWTNQSVALRRSFNQLPLQDPERIRKAGGDPSVFYYSAAWAVAEDEFLVIRLSPIPDCTAWGFQLNNLWTESLDYTQAPIHLNKASAHYDADGGVTIVVSERDPGRPNWLRTMGHRSGTANLRLMGAKAPVTTEVRLVSRREEIGAGGT
ncbi:MAG: hypothetical protein R3F21_04565 [Myxococcota bacterium]